MVEKVVLIFEMPNSEKKRWRSLSSLKNLFFSLKIARFFLRKSFRKFWEISFSLLALLSLFDSDGRKKFEQL